MSLQDRDDLIIQGNIILQEHYLKQKQFEENLAVNLGPKK